MDSTKGPIQHIRQANVVFSNRMYNVKQTAENMSIIWRKWLSPGQCQRLYESQTYWTNRNYIITDNTELIQDSKMG